MMSIFVRGRIYGGLYALACSAVILITPTTSLRAQRQPEPPAARQSSSRGGRLMPPANLKCPDNNLTSFTGRILAYRRAAGYIFIRMRTDEATTESFSLRFPKTETPEKRFLVHGEPFAQGDWKLIERGENRLRPRMRATVWMCDDGSVQVIDWRPRETSSTAVY